MRSHFINPKTNKIYKTGEQIKTRLRSCFLIINFIEVVYFNDIHNLFVLKILCLINIIFKISLQKFYCLFFNHIFCIYKAIKKH